MTSIIVILYLLIALVLYKRRPYNSKWFTILSIIWPVLLIMAVTFWILSWADYEN